MSSGLVPAGPKPLAPGAARIVGVMFLGAGGAICALALGWIDYPPAEIRAPREIVLCAGLAFTFPGLMFLFQGLLPAWIGSLLGALTFSVFALIPVWLAVGAGPRVFGGSGAGLAQMIGFDPGLVGRVVFGIAGLLVCAGAAIAWFAWLASLPRAARAIAAAALVGSIVWLLWGRYLEPRGEPGEDDHARLARLIAAKHAHPDFKYFSGGGGTNPFLQPREEAWIKQVRARLAAARKAPGGADVLGIPAAHAAPILDGRIDAAEWRGGLRVAMVPAEAGGSAILLHRGGRLYLAGEAPADRTEKGFDQMRIYFHLGLSPHLSNERVFSQGREAATGMRSVRVGANGPEKTESSVLAQVRGASAVNGHRQFEIEIDLAEAGLASGAPFPAFLEIEGDPVRDAAGKFKARHIEGRAGSAGEPLWFRILP